MERRKESSHKFMFYRAIDQPQNRSTSFFFTPLFLFSTDLENWGVKGGLQKLWWTLVLKLSMPVLYILGRALTALYRLGKLLLLLPLSFTLSTTLYCGPLGNKTVSHTILMVYGNTYHNKDHMCGLTGNVSLFSRRHQWPFVIGFDAFFSERL